MVFEDLDGSGTRSSDEPGIKGVQIDLTDASSKRIAGATTSEDGRFEFLIAGAGPLTVTEHDPYGFYSTTQQKVSVNGAAGHAATADFGDRRYPDLGASTQTVIDINGGDLEPGDVLWYSISVFNAGTVAAENVIFSETPNEHTKLLSGYVHAGAGSVIQGNAGGDTAITVAMGSLDPGEAMGITFLVQLRDDAPEGAWITAQGTVAADHMPDEPTDFPDTNP